MTAEKFVSLCRVKNVIDKCVELVKAVKGLNAEEFEILIASLERSLEEIK